MTLDISVVLIVVGILGELIIAFKLVLKINLLIHLASFSDQSSIDQHFQHKKFKI